MTTNEDLIAGNGSDVAAALVEAQPLHLVEALTDVIADSAVVAVTTREGAETRYYALERYQGQPDRMRGTLAVHTVNALRRAVEWRTGTDAETSPAVYADVEARRVVAILNDDSATAGPGWRDLRVELDLQPTPEWAHWFDHQGFKKQADFARAIELGEEEISDPSPAVMLDLAQTFQASTSARFKKSGRLKDGRTQLVWEEDIEATAGADSTVTIPDEFTIVVAPFYGVAPRPVRCRLRYRIETGTLAIGYEIVRPEQVQRDAFAELVDELSKTYLIVEGVAPAATKPAAFS